MKARGHEHTRSLKYAANMFDNLQRIVTHESQRKKRMMVTMDQLFEKLNLGGMPLYEILAYRRNGVSDVQRQKLTDASRMFLTTWLDHVKSAYEFPFERDEGANEKGGTLSFHVNEMAEFCAGVLREIRETPPLPDEKPLAKVRGRPRAEVTKTAIRGGLLRNGPQPYLFFEYCRERCELLEPWDEWGTTRMLSEGAKDEWDVFIHEDSQEDVRDHLRDVYHGEAKRKNRAPEEAHRYGFALATTHAVGWGLSNEFGLPVPVVAIGSPSTDGCGRASLVVPLVKAKGEDPRALWCFSEPIELRSTEDNIIWSELERMFPERKAFAWATADEKSIEAWKKLCLETFSARGIEPPNEYHESLKTISKHSN